MDFALSVESSFAVSLLRRFNTWYSVADGNWSNPNTWMSNALDKRNFTSPQPGDNVYINNTVTADLNGIIVNNIYVQGTLIIPNLSTSLFFTVLGDLQANGTVDQSASGAGGSTLVLCGVNNYINNFLCGTTNTVEYLSPFCQDIMPLTYNNLWVSGNNGGSNPVIVPTTYLQPVKSVRSNLVLGGTLTIDSSILQIGTFDLTVTGTTTLGNAAGINKSGSGNVIFIGQFLGYQHNYSGLDFSGGNPTVEIRGGFNVPYYNNGDNSHFKTGTGQWKFTTNNQQWNGVFSNVYQFDCPILISGAITVTVGGVNSPMQLNNTVNGDNVGSTLNIGAGGGIYMNTTTYPMSTGIFNPASGGATATLGFVMNGNYTLPVTTFGALTIAGTGIKTLGGNTTLSGNLNIGYNATSSGNLELSSFALTVGGSTTVNNSCALTKNSATGAVLFIGQIAPNLVGAITTIDFSAGNPNVELRGGAILPYSVTSTFKSGTGTWTFSTNNQTLNSMFNTNNTFDANLLISGAITLTISTGVSCSIAFNGTVNGNNANSILDNRSALGGFILINNATAPMATGKLYCNQAANTFIYGLAGNQDITVPSDATPGYQNLTLQGSGAKRLLGNVSVKGTYTLTGPATLNSNGFSLTNP